jgi:hypothetical protein
MLKRWAWIRLRRMTESMKGEPGEANTGLQFCSGKAGWRKFGKDMVGRKTKSLIPGGHKSLLLSGPGVYQ